MRSFTYVWLWLPHQRYITWVLYHNYADDITIMRPSIGELHEMLKICSSFAQSNNIIFDNKKTVCIKYGKEIVKHKMQY